MIPSKGAMASPTYSLLLLIFSIVICNSSPLPANITSADLGLKEGSCALGDVVYMPGDEFPGSGPCEKCSCAHGEVQCAKQRCEPRPGCKAVHRPDHCCPTYQCECEQEGRIYGNGEKLVDPMDPCRVCYCQGGEVVCRRIACFVRDDCRPRLVPGRCCPEYDNCPVRGVTSLPSMTPSMPNPSVADVEASDAPVQPAEPVMPESKITIKEITPVSEIPVITNVKIKEILPSPSMEVAEYSSSKSPLITREATSEKSPSSVESNESIEKSDTKDVSSLSPELSTTSNEKSAEIKRNDDPSPSKISLSTQQDSEIIFEPKIPSIIPMMGGPSVAVHPEPLTTKAPILEEEDLDHNPAFPPIPDDLFLVIGNHEEETISDQNVDSEHVPIDHEVISVSSVPISTEEPIFKETSGSTVGYISEAVLFTKNNLQEMSSETSTLKDSVSTVQPSSTSRENSMLNMRSVIPTDILNAPSLIADDVTGDVFDVTESAVTTGTVSDESSPTEMTDTDIAPKYLNNESQLNIEENISESNYNVSTTSEPVPKTSENIQSIDEPDQMTSTLSKSTEIISRTEFSSIPIETSDQNPRETSDKDNKDKITVSTPDSLEESTSISPFGGDKDNTESKVTLSEIDNQSFENGETTEFILTSFDSQESTTEDVELIKVSSDTDKSSAIVEPPRARNNNVLTDLINLVGDVASISDHTTGPNTERQNSNPTTISDSEELIPVNVGYKSKNKNWNLNSITEVPLKNKVAVPMMKQKVVEIEEDSDTITDSPPPYDKVEPTTKTPIIDNVSDDTPENKTVSTDRKDFEIITKSYVPTINRRPTKVVMKKSNEKPISEDSSSEDVATSTEVASESNASSFNEATSVSDVSATNSNTEDKMKEDTTELPNTTQ
ncbi:probable GPI-anchored adhesin-like protein PGA55 [Maniola jurtina]|uniref:probable GPI-anchored adhesin-like protein PGA55 n=1 Tax=Maniola jurtina TaxID=191418 RepID=UPI001E68F103|nr:probable GPI-anchored adhesin-like protein PGA55 [Maniola jurtina]